jgi:hypothetical protein
LASNTIRINASNNSAITAANKLRLALGFPAITATLRCVSAATVFYFFSWNPILFVSIFHFVIPSNG